MMIKIIYLVFFILVTRLVYMLPNLYTVEQSLVPMNISEEYRILSRYISQLPRHIFYEKKHNVTLQDMLNEYMEYKDILDKKTGRIKDSFRHGPRYNHSTEFKSDTHQKLLDDKYIKKNVSILEIEEKSSSFTTLNIVQTLTIVALLTIFAVAARYSVAKYFYLRNRRNVGERNREETENNMENIELQDNPGRMEGLMHM